ncbi:hypothetical protein ND861_17050 [Leptospira sp. 2 VSF19]|uniref:Lipoprotein n=1 Tax=Leptospira soteropolitanensis TaxID=2950025 RepID=A0AAW5VK71_9LEPT|nr:hypothetical protein [Leptospira soteropolitanensis]MCW7494356.1 hypothetical protein [Leptospira soteropolitanensis]MCW7501935.1 hypothetical protein [Leptospira soteropolitanensis]MCW7524202.1 hypothetical protein [Leptospira soteropolitanensis]MCW7528067.1 hypothetical protein [Leptospira soteropolitanensis]MCW7531921.1 hypothetical protein [Leptospira soteropolitanensis]
MKKSLLFLIVAVAFVANCSSTTKTIPGLYTTPVDLAPADYTISGDTTGKSCGGRILIFPTGATRKIGFVSSVFTNDYIEAQAIFDAISKVEGANYLVNPRFEYESTNYFFASSTCITVKAKAITLKTGPVK